MAKSATGAIAAAIGAVFMFASVADATQPSRLKDVERRRAQAEAEQKRAAGDARRAQAAIEALDERLVGAAKARAATEAEIAAAEADIRALMEKERALSEGATRASDTLEHALIALARAERGRGRETPLAVAVAASAGRIAADDARDSRAAAEEARRTRVALADRRAQMAVAQARLDSERAAVEALLVEQRARRAAMSALADDAGARMRTLAREAQSLRDLVARTVSRRQTASASRPPAGKAVAVSRASLTRLTPASGEVVRRYGERSAAGAAAGMTIRTRPGAQVLAPSAATVAYAGPFRGYGNVLILDLEEDYAVVLTGAATLLATAGQRVLAGQPIAEMTRDATTAPELYVEVRRGGRPVDPGRWLAAGR